MESSEATSDIRNNKISLNTLKDSCRVCMAQRIDMICLFNQEKDNIVDEIQFCTGIELKPDDELPSQICDTCRYNLKIAYKFKTTCLLADETFRQLLLSSIKPEPEISDIEYEEIEYKEDEVLAAIDNEKKQKIRVKKETIRSVRGRPKKCNSKEPRRLKKYKFKKLSCEPCNLKFDTKEQTEEHRKEVHKDSENWVCEICGKMFVHRSSHYTHVKSHQPPQHGCDQCDYKTWHKYDLAKHLRIHSGTKIYQCEYCTRSYHTSSNLTSHIRRHHMNEKSHQCSICRRTFYDRTKLNRHVDSHLEIKRFECDVCHAGFTRRCYWKKHLLRQHDIVTPPQRPGRQKTNLVIGDYPITIGNRIAEAYPKDVVTKVQ